MASVTIWVRVGLCLLAGCAGIRALGARDFTITALVDDQTPRPDGAGNFYPVNPSIDGNTIVFNQGDSCAGCAAPDSIWAADLGSRSFRKLADTSTPVPGGTGTFRSFDSGPIVRNGMVVFIAADANSRPGLYVVPAAGGAVVRLADTNTAIPGATAILGAPALFRSFARGGFHHDGSTAVFTGSSSGVSGVYSVQLDGSALARVADSNTPVNSSTCDLFPVTSYSKPSISSGNIAFLGHTTLDYGPGFTALYTNPLSRAAAPGCGGPTPSAANSMQELPGIPGAHYQTVFDYGRLDGTTLVFRASETASGFGGIFSTSMGASPSGGTLAGIVDSTTALPGFGRVPYAGNYVFAADAGNVVFHAHGLTGTGTSGTGTSGTALFLAARGAIRRIAGTGDIVDGKALLSVDPPGGGAVRGNAVTFTGMRDGSSRAIYVAIDGSRVPDRLAVFRSGTWLLDGDASGAPGKTESFGQPGDQPVAGDWDGTGVVRIGVFRNGAWYLDLNNNGQWDGVEGGDAAFQFGSPGDIAVVGDWNGDGISKPGIFRCPPAGGDACAWMLDQVGKFAFDPATARVLTFGLAGDLPAVNNWSGTSADQVGVFRNGVWIVDSNGNGISDPADSQYSFGLPGDIPVVGNWTGSGKRIGVFRQATGCWLLSLSGAYPTGVTSGGAAGSGSDTGGDTSGNGAPDPSTRTACAGQPGDVPVAGRWTIP